MGIQQEREVNQECDRNVCSEPAETIQNESGGEEGRDRFRAYLVAALRNDQIPKFPDEEDASSENADACKDGNVPWQLLRCPNLLVHELRKSGGFGVVEVLDTWSASDG